MTFNCRRLLRIPHQLPPSPSFPLLSCALPPPASKTAQPRRRAFAIHPAVPPRVGPEQRALWTVHWLAVMRSSRVLQRFRTAWRELLHPLPVKARQSQWLKRDTVEMNEALLRRPYYTLKSYQQPAYVRREDLGGVTASASCTVQDPDHTMIQALRTRHVTSPAQLQALRDQLRFPTGAGPPLPPPQGAGGSTATYVDEYGPRLRPRYPQSWETVPPHQPSRHDG
eukprot:gene2084-1265_t